jgi:two-component sensor histidine kinase
MDLAVPCGLIVNELLSNTLKYAFPPDRTGSIEVGLKLQRGQISKYILSVRDNGVGLPEKIDPKNTNSMGLQIVRSLTQQLDGTLEVDRRNGTSFLVKFPESSS